MEGSTSARGYQGEVEWLDLTHAARYVGLSVATLREAINAGELVAHVRPRSEWQRGREDEREGSRRNVMVKISRRALNEWMENQPLAYYGA